MYQKLVRRFRELILSSRYVVTLHAYDEMAADDLTVWDVESVVLTGEIIEKQVDADTSESKYRIRGLTLGGASAEVVAKLGVTGKMVVITVYAL